MTVASDVVPLFLGSQECTPNRMIAMQSVEPRDSVLCLVTESTCAPTSRVVVATVLNARMRIRVALYIILRW
jgi:hypothetical protein